MSGWGGFAPLPIRLGGSSTEGWTAAQHARAAADLVAVGRTARLAVFRATVSSGSVTLHSYRGINGVGTSDAPTLTSSGTGVLDVTFPAVYETDREEFWAVSIRSVMPGAHGTTALIALTSAVTPNTFSVTLRNATTGAAVDGEMTVVVEADFAVMGRRLRIGDYGGATDKVNTYTEVIPYAWTWYQAYEAMLGTAYTTSRFSQVHVKKLALARNDAAITRCAEKYGANQLPGTSHEALGEWSQLLRILADGSESVQEIRQLCATAFQLTGGNDKASVDEAVAALLGDTLVQLVRNYGASLSAPPAGTYWPGVNPGLPGLNLGGGTWTSPRARLVVVVDRPSSIEDKEFDYLVNVKLMRMLDDLLPAWASANWTTSTGFELDISFMDFDGFGAS